MPFRRQTNRRRGAPAARGKKLTKRQTRQVKKIVAVRQELKYFEAVTNAFAISTTGATFTLSNPAQGDTDITRNGDRLYAKKMYVRGVWRIGDTTNIVRLIFYQWKPNSVPTLALLLLNGPSGAVDVFSQYSHDNRQEYKILWDKTYVLEGNGAAATDPIGPASLRRFQMILSRGINHQLQFQAAGTTGTNQIYYAAISDSGAATHPSLTMMTKFMYTDG